VQPELDAGTRQRDRGRGAAAGLPRHLTARTG
jgi:hypothetical protein